MTVSMETVHLAKDRPRSKEPIRMLGFISRQLTLPYVYLFTLFEGENTEALDKRT